MRQHLDRLWLVHNLNQHALLAPSRMHPCSLASAEGRLHPCCSQQRQGEGKYYAWSRDAVRTTRLSRWWPEVQA